MKKTKIVGTMGPASEDKVVLRQLMLAGLNVARMNFSHGDHAEHLGRLSQVRALNEELGTNVGVMLDTRGPEMRTNEFEGGKVIIQKDDEVTLVFEEVLGTSEKFSINYPGLFDDVEVGTKILIDDGYLQTVVISKNKKDRSLVVKADNTHMIKNRRGVNIPNTLINMPFLSEKDREDILFGVEQQVDFIALSFVQKKEDVLEVRELINAHGGEKIQIISKIENQAGVDNIDEIIEASEGIMYARGDLGVEILPEDLPHIQKEVIEKCRQANKLVIVATQMLESMQNNPIPTRAEVSDVANAVFDGTDTVMLSGEMAAGKYPVESVKMMQRIIVANEKHVDFDEYTFPLASDDSVVNNLSFMAKVSVEYSDVKAIVATSAKIATSISKYRPDAPIVALSSKDEATKLNASFGVYPVTSNEELEIKKELTKLGLNKDEKYLLVNETSVTIESL